MATGPGLNATINKVTDNTRQRCPLPAIGIFCLLFVAAWTKSMARVGARADGLDLSLDKDKPSCPASAKAMARRPAPHDFASNNNTTFNLCRMVTP